MNKPKPNAINLRSIAHSGIIIFLCIICYQHALNGNFVFDDNVAILKNHDVITRPANITSIFSNDFWGVPIVSNDSHKSYRPLTILMFNLEYAYFRWQARHMKIVNLVIHCINALLMWFLLDRIKHKYVFQGKEHAIPLETIAASLFAIHPIHTESVCGIVGRADLIVCSLYFIALLLCLHPSMVNDVIIIGITAIGLLFKETAITIPLACIFVDIFLHKNSLRDIVYDLRLWIYGFITMSLILIRLKIQQFQYPVFKAMDNPFAFNENLYERIMSQQFLHAVNMWLLLCPQWLCYDWALGCIKLITTVWDLRLYAVLPLYAYIVYMLIYYKHMKTTLLCFGLILIPYLPVSGIIKVGFVIAERVLYIPSIGFCLFMANCITHLYKLVDTNWWRKYVNWNITLLFICYILRTRERANDWLTEDRLFTSALKVCGNNAKVHYNVARLASRKSETNAAFYHYHKAVELYPHYESALMNLGNLYRETGDLAQSEKYIKESIEAMPTFAVAWMNLGIVQTSLKRYDEAIDSYKTALKLRTNYSICYYNLGNLYLELKQYDDAVVQWQKAVEVNPRQAKPWINILIFLDNRGSLQKVLELSTKALNYLPNEASILFLRANVLGKMKRYKEAEHLYNLIIKSNPRNLMYYTNLGVLYHRWEKYEQAIECYNRALQIDSFKATTARLNIRKLLKKLKKNETS